MRRKQRGFIDALILGGSALLGSALSASGQRSANQQNIQLGREQMQFQERMSNTAYQRAVEDMGKAGLNPMLAYSQGGASAPVGSMPQVQNASAAFANSGQSALAVMQGIQQLAQTEAGTKQIIAQTKRTEAETLTNQIHTAAAIANIRKTGADTDLAEQEHDRRTSANPITNMILELDRQIKTSSAAREAGTWEEDVKRRKAERELSQLAIPEAKSSAQFFNSIGQSQPWLRMILEILKARK